MNEPTKLSAAQSKAGQRRSYLLRLWRVDQSGSSNWQASLEDPQTGQRIGFASLEQLFGFLMDLSASDGSVQRSSSSKSWR